MRRWLRQLGIGLAVLAVVFVGVRRFAFLAVERRGLIGAPNGPETPASFGAPFEPLAIASGDRTLDATLVRAESDSAPALLIFHGTAEANSYWADTQALLRRQGITGREPADATMLRGGDVLVIYGMPEAREHAEALLLTG